MVSFIYLLSLWHLLVGHPQTCVGGFCARYPRMEIWRHKYRKYVAYTCMFSLIYQVLICTWWFAVYFDLFWLLPGYKAPSSAALQSRCPVHAVNARGRWRCYSPAAPMDVQSISLFSLLSCKMMREEILSAYLVEESGDGMRDRILLQGPDPSMSCLWPWNRAVPSLHDWALFMSLNKRILVVLRVLKGMTRGNESSLKSKEREFFWTILILFEQRVIVDLLVCVAEYLKALNYHRNGKSQEKKSRESNGMKLLLFYFLSIKEKKQKDSFSKVYSTA